MFWTPSETVKKCYFISCDGATLTYANTNFTPFDQIELKKMLNGYYDIDSEKPFMLKSFAKKKGQNLFWGKNGAIPITITWIHIFLHVQKLEAF